MRSMDCIKLETKPCSSSHSILRGHELKHKPWPVQKQSAAQGGHAKSEECTLVQRFELPRHTLRLLYSCSLHNQHPNIHLFLHHHSALIAALCRMHTGCCMMPLDQGSLSLVQKDRVGEDELDVLCSTSLYLGSLGSEAQGVEEADFKAPRRLRIAPNFNSSTSCKLNLKQS